MFSHVVIFWTEGDNPQAVDQLIAGANECLRGIPGILQFHIGKTVSSNRAVVEKSYHVGLNIIFANKKAQDDYQAHPKHVEFVDKYVKPLVVKVVVYDFE